MKIKTTRFGEIEFPESDIITFPDGILGFPRENKYVFIDTNPDGLLKWLQSLNDPELAFVVCDPTIIDSEYLSKIKGCINNKIVVVIMCIPEDYTKMTANMKGPILIDKNTKEAEQIVLVDPEFDSHYKIFLKTEEERSDDS